MHEVPKLLSGGVTVSAGTHSVINVNILFLFFSRCFSRAERLIATLVTTQMLMAHFYTDRGRPGGSDNDGAGRGENGDG